MRGKIPDKETLSVSVIPATKRFVQSGGQFKEQKYMRVAAYCRISTGDESQQTSYSKQKDFYTRLIQEKQNWTLAGIYADEAISGTSRAKRIQFNCMITDALEGKIDYIITKSISRFARNTVDALDSVRQLRQQDPPVGIYFEKENIDTLDAKGELVLTILSALAQEESRSISDNIRWTFQKNFREGKAQINLKRMLGYDKGENGAWLINPEQAFIVRHIFQRYLLGYSANQIAGELNTLGKTTVNGKVWRSDTVYNILRNEKYVGDLEMQKTITKDFLTHRSVVNNGEAPKYYVKNHHVGIIDRSTWDRTQLMLQTRKAQHEKPSEEATMQNAIGKIAPKASLFANLKCAACQGSFQRLTYTSEICNYSDERSLASQGQNPDGFKETYSYAYPVWRCEKKYGRRGKDGRLSEKETTDLEKNCPSKVIHEAAIKQSFMEMLYRLKRDCQQNGDNCELIKKYHSAYQETYLKTREKDYALQRREEVESQIQDLEKCYQKIESESSCADLRSDIRRKVGELKSQKEKLESTEGPTAIMKRNFSYFLKSLQNLPERNPAGQPLHINMPDTDAGVFADGTGESGKERLPLPAAPDYLDFEPGIYRTFISRGVVKGDEICFYTNFGVMLASRGNSRKLKSFLGFRSCLEDGTVEVMTETYQVNGRKIQYRRKER